MKYLTLCYKVAIIVKTMFLYNSRILFKASVVVTISNNMYSYDGNIYIPRGQGDSWTGFLLASAASSAIMGTMPLFSKPFIKQMKKEHINNDLYREALFKSLNISGLKEKGVRHPTDVPWGKKGDDIK